jgi:hypothetical protein
MRFKADGFDEDFHKNYMLYRLTVAQEVRERYKDQLAQAGFFKRIRLYLMINKEVSKIVEKRFGRRNLYFFRR